VRGGSSIRTREWRSISISDLISDYGRAAAAEDQVEALSSAGAEPPRFTTIADVMAWARAKANSPACKASR
jgi:hypothetical protein